MNLSLIPALLVSLVSPLPSPQPVSPERLQELIKKLEEPRRGNLDPKHGPPEGIPPARGFRVKSEVIRELASAGPTAVDPLIALFEDRTKPSQARSQAVAALTGHLIGWVATPNPKALAAVRRALRDKDPAVRENVLISLHWRGANWNHGLHGAPSPAKTALSAIALKAILPDVVAAIPDEDPGVAARAAKALFFLAQEGVGVSELLAALRRKEPDVRWAALVSLAQVGRGDPRVFPALKEQLAKKDFQTARVTVLALGEFGPTVKECAPQFIEYLNDKRTHQDHELGLAVVEVLGKIGPDAKAAVPSLLEFFRTVPLNPAYRQQAIEAITRIDPDAGRQASEIERRKREEYQRWKEEMIRRGGPPEQPQNPPGSP